MIFQYPRRVQFYETDAMGIVHHAIYLHWFEEARVEFLRTKGLFKEFTLDQINYPLLESHIEYKKPLSFDDEFVITLRVEIDKLRITFTYEIQTKRFPEPTAFGKTVHIAMDMTSRKPVRLPQVLRDKLAQR